MLFCLYSTVFSEMDYFLILAQGLLLCSGVTRTWCKWEAKVGRNVNSSVPTANVLVHLAARVALRGFLNILTCFCREKCKERVHYQTKFCSDNLGMNCLVVRSSEEPFPPTCYSVNNSDQRKENLRVCVCTIITPSAALSNISALLCFSSLASFKVKKYIFFPLPDPLLVLPLSFSFSYPSFWSPKTSVHQYHKLRFMSPRCPLSAFQGELLPAELLPVRQTGVFAGEASRF